MSGSEKCCKGKRSRVLGGGGAERSLCSGDILLRRWSLKGGQSEVRDSPPGPVGGGKP